jgi:hypothetical protein
MVYRFEIQKGKDEKFFFTLVSEDGIELVRGLHHFNKSHARKDAESVAGCLGDGRVRKKEFKGEFYFALHDEKDQMFARSRYVKGPLALDETLDEAKAAAVNATVVDVSEGGAKRVTAR